MYADGCLRDTAGSEASTTREDFWSTTIGKAHATNGEYAGVNLDEFTFWERELGAPHVMALYIRDR